MNACRCALKDLLLRRASLFAIVEGVQQQHPHVLVWNADKPNDSVWHAS